MLYACEMQLIMLAAWVVGTSAVEMDMCTRKNEGII